jgi:hypothetical protein
MFKFKLDIPADFEDQIRKEVEKKLADCLRRDGFHNVTAKIDRNGQAVFSGSDEDLKRVEKAVERWRL